ncbi:MAG: glucose 1-dehydrogenase [Actinobacteria bacterium]|nr:glucose 1-dehydrogenase [Actinomycetota bacterium]MCL6105588.1 glucose 1-dehydrogenase [Actinomycetota bacterium]
MKALTVIPKKADSLSLSDIDEPLESDGDVLVETLAVGVCGTDFEIVSGAYGWPPKGKDRLVLGHESLGRVLEVDDGVVRGDGEIKKGDLVVGIVRRPDPVPCHNCAIGEWDFCRNGLYTERGIKEHDGYCSERYRISPNFAVKVDPSLGTLGVLLEPTSVVAKAWEQVMNIGNRAFFGPKKVVVTGAGPIGLLAALLGVQKGLEVHVLDRVSQGIKPDLVAGIGAHYHDNPLRDVLIDGDTNVVLECTGVGELVFDAMEHLAPGGVVCLTGVSSGGRALQVDAGALNRSMVLENEAVVGSVNANRRHYQAAADALAKADPAWLNRLITRKVPLDEYAQAFVKRDDDVKVVIEVSTDVRW